jgi:NodT family efflux transporter outer membrane factor (OMF) lipoprotein
MGPADAFSKQVNASAWTPTAAIARIAYALALSWAASCTVGPDYQSPSPTMPEAWTPAASTQPSVTVPAPIELDAWWTTFNDPELDSLVQRAVASNLDMEAAAERVRQARAAVGVVRAGYFPAVNAAGSYTYAGTGATSPQSLWQVGLDALWEIDIFGGVRRSVEAANANLDAAVEDRRDVLVTLLGELATNYLALRGFQQELLIARQNLEVQIRNSKLTREKQKLGTGSGLDVAQSDAQISTTKAQIATFEEQRQQTVYAISVLLGLPPATLLGELEPIGQIPSPPGVLPVGVPANLLRRRPDIRRAERELASATAQIGVATADLYPKFSLTGSLGLQGTHIRSFGTIDDRFWSISPGVTVPILDAGRIRSNIEVQNALEAQAFTAYRRTILAALQEVEASLVAFAREQERRSALADAVTANQRAFALASSRYSHGLTDFLSVLDSERSLFVSQDALVQSDRAVGTSAVALYKALGGGWDIGEETPAQPAGGTR